MTDDELFGRPTAAELVAAVREFLEGDVMAATEGRVRFHARVAANVLAVVERELELGPDIAASHAADLERLGVASEAELAAAVRDGRFEGREAELVEVLRRTTTGRLRVANPRHLDG
ncbi:MAG TPA: DUF6285 domain-containing protein [Acidimicrobiales bacterium]|nr:DUF6285 domain-containing protein [Acidimicrobiales bacterium]